MTPVGRVYLVGAGPGDPGLITVRGLDLLRQADVLVYDRLVAAELVAEAPVNAERRYVGRARGEVALDQAGVNQLLVARAQAGKRVVRLKGGDPFVFGRGGEEAEACAAAGVPFEVVPGISSAIAVPSYAGIPLTHRAVASSFAVVTGHDASTATTGIDWGKLQTDTLVVLMGVVELPRIVDQLLRHGRDPSTPVAVISQGTQPGQKTLVSSLGAVAVAVVEQDVRAPAVLVVGEVVRLHAQLAWFQAPDSVAAEQ